MATYRLPALVAGPVFHLSVARDDWRSRSRRSLHRAQIAADLTRRTGTGCRWNRWLRGALLALHRTPIALPPWQRNKVLAAGFSSDGSDLLLGTQDGKIRTYSSATGAPLSDAAVLSAMADRLIADAPGGLLIALSQSGGLAVWNQRKPQLTIQGGDFPLFARFDAARRLDLLPGVPG